MTPPLWRAVILLLLLWSTLAGFGDRVAEHLLPLQQSAFVRLTSGLALERFALQSQQGHLRLHARLVAREPIAAPQGVLAPGLAIDASTPARTLQLCWAVLGIGWAWRASRGVRDARIASLLAIPMAAALSLVPPLLLAGHAWSLIVGPFDELSLRAACVLLSEVLLFGGLTTLGIVAAVCVAFMIQTDHAASSVRTTR